MVSGDRREDELEPLPPLDGDGKDPPEEEDDFGDVIEESTEDATLDDSTAEDDPPDVKDLDLDGAESGLTNDAAEAHDLDLGEDAAIADFGEEASSPAEDEPAVDDEDYGLAEGPERGGLDAGDEGPIDEDEELRDADLPALDADEEGDLDEAALIDAGFASDEPLGLPWAANPWLRVGAPVSLVGATAVAIAPRGAIAAGRGEDGAAELVHVDLEGSCERLQAEGLGAGAVVGLAVDGPLVAAVEQGGRLLLSFDGGRAFKPVSEPIGDAVFSAVEAVFAQDQLWVRTRSGGLVMLTAPVGEGERSPPPVRIVRPREGEQLTVERSAVPGAASALTNDGGTAGGSAVALVVDEVGRPTALVHASGSSPARREAVEAPAASSPPLFAVRGAHVAYAARHRGIVRRAGSGPWIWSEWEGRVTAVAFVDDAGTLVASTYSDSDDTSALVQLDPSGKATVVARTGSSPTDADSDGRVAALAYDDARGVVWLAGGFGVASFARAR
jgi:hypothetical protein